MIWAIQTAVEMMPSTNTPKPQKTLKTPATTSTDSIADVPTVIEFDPASFVLTAYGRMNAGTVHGDRELGHEFLDGFFRI